MFHLRSYGSALPALSGPPLFQKPGCAVIPDFDHTVILDRKMLTPENVARLPVAHVARMN